MVGIRFFGFADSSRSSAIPYKSRWSAPVFSGAFPLPESARAALWSAAACRATDFETAMQDAADAEAATAEAVANVENKRVERDAKVVTLQLKIALVINGVVGNPAYGPDSDLLRRHGIHAQIPAQERPHAEVERPAAGAGSPRALALRFSLEQPVSSKAATTGKCTASVTL
jgi:hypothetical protein